ncbi:MAG: MobA/MobL family protein [Faecousia sp.]
MELHTHLKVIGRGSKGRTCCASAAYRTGQNIHGIDGHLYRFDRKQGVTDAWTLYPKGTPENLKSTEALWQAADRAEQTAAGEWRKNAQLYRDWNAGVPNTFSYAQTKALLNELVQPFVDEGMAVTNAIHDPPPRPGKERNLHVHVMFTMREMTDGGFGKKNRSWNRSDFAEELRTRWANICNRELLRMGRQDSVEHESFASRDIDRIPTEHMGVSAAAMERKGIKTTEGTKLRLLASLQEIHDTNRQFCEQQTHSLDELIAHATGKQRYRHQDYEGLYNLVKEASDLQRELRRERARGRKLLDQWKLYRETQDAQKRQQAAGFIRWAGGDPDSDEQYTGFTEMQREIQEEYTAAKQLKAMLFETSNQWKAQNKLAHARSNAYWSELKLHKKSDRIDSQKARLKKLKQIRKNCYRSYCFYMKHSRDYGMAQHKRDTYRHFNKLVLQAQAELKQSKKDQRVLKKEYRAAQKNLQLIKDQQDQNQKVRRGSDSPER